MIRIIGVVLGVILVLAVMAQIVGFGVLYTVDETEYVVITQFGQVKRAVTTPGLKFKSPIETAVRFDKRLLRIDVPVASMPDRESQFLDIDAYVRYRIDDPRKFLENLENETIAADRIGRIAIGAIREEIGLREQKDIIGGNPVTLEDGSIIVNARVTAEGVGTRESMMQLVLDRVREDAEQQFGIEIRDVRIKRADFPSSIESSVLERMRTERDVQGQRLRAEGEELYLTLTADVNRRVRVIGADAQRDANILRGDGEAQAIFILAEALEQDPEFFAFRRSLEAYGNFLQDGTTVVLAADSDLFQYLGSPNPTSDEAVDSDTESGQ